MHKYLQLLMQQQPIESQFIRSLEDNLNAEICLGKKTLVPGSHSVVPGSHSVARNTVTMLFIMVTT